MNKKKTTFLIVFLTITLLVLATTNFLAKGDSPKTHKLTGIVLNKEKQNLTLQTSNNIIYTFKTQKNNFSVGDNILIEYTGLLNRNKKVQDSAILNCIQTEEETDSNGIPLSWKDNGLFKDYYILAKNKLDELTLEEKIGQLLLVKYKNDTAKQALEKNQFSGFIFFENDFKDKTKEEVVKMIESLNEVAKIPLLTAVDEEGGDVVRVSSNKKLAPKKFSSPSELYKEGGLSAIKEDTIEKSALLKDLGLNLNLAPVVDVSNSDEDYIYNRTLQEDTAKTAEYAKTVISASKNTGVSYTLKHFPGYGDNEDTHDSGTTDERSLELIKEKDLPPFQASIEAKAEAILVNHNTVKNIENTPASLSSKVNQLLRNDLKFTGVTITDDMEMGALSSIENKYAKALLAGNNLLIVGDYDKAITEIKKSLEENELSENLINKLAFKVLAWKYYKGLLFEIHK